MVQKEDLVDSASCSIHGTIVYTAPEVLRNNPADRTKGDVWSFGVILWEMLTRRIPYEGVEKWAAYYKICQIGLNENSHEHLLKVIAYIYYFSLALFWRFFVVAVTV